MGEIARARKIVLTGLFAALAVLLSGIHFPIGPTKVFPFQHMVNAVAGVLIGLWCGAVAALLEPLGTGGIGVLAITLLFGPLMGKDFAFAFFFTAFMASSIPGSILGYLLLKTLRRTKVLEPRGGSGL
jgi:predicted membrane protein